MKENQINFLRDSLMHHRNLKDSLDSKASFLLAVAGIIFSFSVGRLNEPQFLFLTICAFFTVFLSLLVIRSPFRRLANKKFSMVCWFGFADKDYAGYKKGLKKVLASDEKIAEEYEREIWSLANYSIKPKARYLKLGSTILTIGLLGGFILFFI